MQGAGRTGYQSRATPRKQTALEVFVPEERLFSAASSHFRIRVGMDLRTELRYPSECGLKILYAFLSEKQLPA